MTFEPAVHHSFGHTHGSDLAIPSRRQTVLGREPIQLKLNGANEHVERLGIIVHVAQPGSLTNSTAFALSRAFAYAIVNVYAIKMAGVFMLITSTIAVRTAFVARWMAAPGFAMALFLLFASQWFDWSFVVFPVWVLLISVYILIIKPQDPAA